VTNKKSPYDFTVYILDDDQSTLDSLSGFFRSLGYKTKPYAAAKAFFDEQDPSTHGCVLLDQSMPGINGLNVHQELLARGIERPIIFLTGNDSGPTIVEAFKGGAVDFLIKPAQEGELLRAIKIAAKRDSDRLHNLAIARRFETLTRREKEVLALVVRGASNKDIAADLGIVLTTVKVHRERGVKKMGAKNVADLVRMTRKILW